MNQIKWAIMNPGEELPSPRVTKRFETTSLAGTEYVASRRGEVPDRGTMIRELEQRKLRNTKASVDFGSAKILYESDAMSRQKDILGAPPRGEDEKRNKELKQALTRTHFTFGDEPMVYERTSTLPDPTGHLEEYTGVLNTEVKNMIKNTNLSFGNAPTFYRTMATDQMDLQAPPQGDRGVQLENNRQLKVALTRTHFKFGEEDMDYTTDHQMGFQYDPEKVKLAGNKGLAKEVKADLSRTHFTLGNHKFDWQTDAMRTQRASGGMVSTADERQAQVDKNKALKKQLQTTHYEIGTDDDYM
ncbi:unnamed protein product [Hapterophycus canaliculatus]